MKKHFPNLMGLLLALICALPVSAYDFQVDGIYYNISGTNAIAVTHHPNHYSGRVTIPKSVTYNGQDYSVTTIGNSAFSQCPKLTGVTIPESVTSIGASAFSSCVGLTEVTIPNSVTSIGIYTFSGCSGLTEVTIPESVTSIGEAVFSRCTGLTEVAIPISVTSIGASAFSSCVGLTEVTIPNSVTSIGNRAFSECRRLAKVTIGKSVTSIGLEAFGNCESLSEVTILNSDNSFDITRFAFKGSDRLEAFYGTNASDDNRCWIVDGKLMCFAPSGLTKYSIPNSVTKIGYGSFYACKQLTEVVIPNSVTAIEKSAFHSCTALTEVNIPNSVTSLYTSILYGCRDLTSIKVNNSNPANIRLMDFGVFDGVPISTCILYVPVGSKELYARYAEWYAFRNIVEFDDSDSSIEGIEVDTQNDDIYFDMMGRRVLNPTQGLYIHNGRKVFIK